MSIDRAVPAGSMGNASRSRLPWPARVIIVDSPSVPISTSEREYRAIGLAVVRRDDAASALVELGHAYVDAVVVPTDLVGMSIVDFTDVVRSLTKAVVLIALAHESERDIAVAALGAGARGIVGLPIDPPRLVDELRHVSSSFRDDHDVPAELSCGHVTLSSREHRVYAAGVEVRLSPKEFALLEYLMREAPRAVRLHELLEVFENGDSEHGPRVRVAIAKVRLRLAEAAPHHLDIVHTIRGVGYRVST